MAPNHKRPRTGAAGANRKRRAETADASESLASTEAAARVRKATTREIVERMRQTQGFLSETEVESARAMAHKVTLANPRTGEEREFDLSKPEDIDELAGEHGTNVMSTDDASLGQKPQDMFTGMIALRRENLPDNVNTTGVLPLSGFELKKYMRDSANSLSDILLWMPLLNIPVFTPKLLTLIMLGTPTWPTQDSFLLLRTYIAVMKILMYAETTRTRKNVALNWLSDRFKSKMLSREDLEAFLDRMVLKVDPNKADAEDVIAWHQEISRYQLERFDEEEYSEDLINDLHKAVRTTTDDAHMPWHTDAVCAEDIMEEHTTAGTRLCEEIGQAMEACNFYVDELEVMNRYTARMLRLYEVAIMRLLSHASVVGPTIPDELFGELASKEDVWPTQADVHFAVAKQVREGRAEITRIRAEAMGKTAPATRDIFPSSEEMTFFAKEFVNYHADEEQDLVEVIQRMQDSVHISEPAPIVEDVSCADPSKEEGEVEMANV